MQSVPNWPLQGIAIEGDFSGIQRFVLRPVPGAGGAARRLRARSFRVLALTRLVAETVLDRFRGAGAQLFYSAGGRFLVVTAGCENWMRILAALQRELDDEFLRADRGELIFHLAGAEFADGKIPVTKLHEGMEARKQRPLSEILRESGKWATDRFVFGVVHPIKCDGCGATAVACDETENLCKTCVDDRELGKELLQARHFALKKSSDGSIFFLGQHWSVAADGTIPISLISHSPLMGNQLATFEDLSTRAVGRDYLAYMRIDADRIGDKFRQLSGDPVGVWQLSNRLNNAFSSGVSALLRERFRNIYPVYGGGDDLFVIGPWNDILDFAVAWRSEFQKLSEGKLAFSAGVALARPRQHILTKSNEAEDVLNDCAKAVRDSIHVLGTTIPFSEFEDVLGCARQLSDLILLKQINKSFLSDLVELHERWRLGEANPHEGDPRWHSLLFYQLERNLKGDAKSFALRAFLSPGYYWKYAGFVARYAMLRTGGEEKS